MCSFRVCEPPFLLQVSLARVRKQLTYMTVYSVLSVKGKKVLHVDRNDHYGG